MTTTTGTGVVLACPGCGLDGGPFPTAGEARQLAGIHDRLHHGGHPTATTRPAAADDHGASPAAWIEPGFDNHRADADDDADDQVWAW